MDYLNFYVVHEADATRYEIAVSYVNNKNSDYDAQYVVSLVNFGECFFDTDLDFIAEAIIKKSKVFSATDAINIQNGIAKYNDEVRTVSFDYDTREIIYS